MAVRPRVDEEPAYADSRASALGSFALAAGVAATGVLWALFAGKDPRFGAAYVHPGILGTAIWVPAAVVAGWQLVRLLRAR